METMITGRNKGRGETYILAHRFKEFQPIMVEKALQSNLVHGGRSVIAVVHIMAMRERLGKPQCLGINFKGPSLVNLSTS